MGQVLRFPSPKATVSDLKTATTPGELIDLAARRASTAWASVLMNAIEKSRGLFHNLGVMLLSSKMRHEPFVGPIDPQMKPTNYQLVHDEIADTVTLTILTDQGKEFIRIKREADRGGVLVSEDWTQRCVDEARAKWGQWHNDHHHYMLLPDIYHAFSSVFDYLHNTERCQVAAYNVPEHVNEYTPMWFIWMAEHQRWRYYVSVNFEALKS